MSEIKEFKQLGAYGLVICDEKILLIKKHGGPYDRTLDLPGGTIEFCERPEEAMIRELKEEVGIDVKKYELFDADSVAFDWQYKDVMLRVHHTGIFFKIMEYSNEIRKNVELDRNNEDSLGADFYDIKNLTKKDLSKIAILELEKLGYKID